MTRLGDRGTFIEQIILSLPTYLSCRQCMLDRYVCGKSSASFVRYMVLISNPRLDCVGTYIASKLGFSRQKTDYFVMKLGLNN